MSLHKDLIAMADMAEADGWASEWPEKMRRAAAEIEWHEFRLESDRVAFRELLQQARALRQAVPKPLRRWHAKRARRIAATNSISIQNKL